MLNFNGTLIAKSEINLSSENRAFKYGDAIFETINILNKRVVFWEDHYFRLMASMRMLRMDIPMSFTLEYLENEILKTIENSLDKNLRIRLTVFRKDGGLYAPVTNEVDFLIEASENTYQTKKEYRIDLFKDFYNYSGLLSTIKNQKNASSQEICNHISESEQIVLVNLQQLLSEEKISINNFNQYYIP